MLCKRMPSTEPEISNCRKAVNMMAECEVVKIFENKKTQPSAVSTLPFLFYTLRL